MFGLIFFGIVLVALYVWKQGEKRKIAAIEIPVDSAGILEKEVSYFRSLPEADKPRFLEEVKQFLSVTRITPIGTTIDDTDRLLVAASAVIPIFGFPEWHYTNLTDVLIYNDRFDEEFDTKSRDGNILGMVGSGVMNHKMILSKAALREGFSNKTDKQNTAIHEFVHLLDKADGAVDGIPEALLSKQYTLPWLNLIHKKIQEIKADDSDINPYGASSQTEFFAVAAEYFFERPDLLRSKHPRLYEMMEKIFHQTPPTRVSKAQP
ncbi:M90 family metallopeptidase [Flavihumibacter sp. CACIAM 22H1]|uniref:M90 family metallopeptidase n=1 Tax=Flavihumibacter sp. CACIAM 22H1 TaxID=1812911 RepID=UPI0007A89F7A|nr:M90 family metallopeptidase [Flavihumibacter sp. CACIAM 22H1]KYP15425.1 MAG: peptidase [Flavihumibacter sp. CACIAM 22H1]